MDRTRCQTESSLALRCVPKAKYLLVLQQCQQSEILGKVPSDRAQRLPLFLCCAVLCLVSQMGLALCDSMDCSPPGFSRQEYWSGMPCPPPEDHPNSGTEPRSTALQADSLSTKPPGQPKNTGLGSLSLLQGIFPTQESNQGLLHCR